ncbi:uncharacterized protein BDR25DRAFT_164563, partial [Lindgomyces ingoldianus]
WVAGPGSRGTLSLVFSCGITLFLCVWTTVQVNIEPQENLNPTLARFIPIRALKKNKALLKLLAKRWVRKLGWSLIALIMPEGVMAIAAYERKIANLLLSQVDKIIPKGPERWDMFLAYYAIMGGFVILGNRGEENDDLQDINRLLTLTPYGVLQLLKWQWGSSTQKHGGKLINITSDEVRDKSNADLLNKLIVAWQALWMIAQVIGRRAEYPDIPVTLLELHTCLHAFAAFAMYLTWWNKPVDINLPTTV